MNIIADEDAARRTILVALSKSTCVVLTETALLQLVDEMGDLESAFRWLYQQATIADRPIGIHFGTRDEGLTHFVPPSGWSAERLHDYMISHQQYLGEEFGEIFHWEQQAVLEVTVRSQSPSTTGR